MVSFSSCKDDVNSDTISSEEATEIVAMSLSEDAMGATAFVSTTVNTSENTEANGMLKAPSSTAYSKDTTVTYTSKSGALISYTLNADFSYSFGVDVANKVTTGTIEFSYNGNFDAPRLSSTHTGTGNFTLDNFTTSTCDLNGVFKRTSDVKTKGLNSKQSNSETTITFTDVIVNKSTGKIESGSATVGLTGTLSSKGNFSYAGTIVFEGNGSATLTFGNASFYINLETGDYEKF